MMPGKGVNEMARVATTLTAGAIGKFEKDEKIRRIDLWEWVQHEMTIATTESVYGPKNPYQGPEIEKAFWNFADDSVMILAGLMPRILAPKGYDGREKVVTALRNYFVAKGHEMSSCLVKARLESLERDVTTNDIARSECVNGIAILSNTVPTTFWSIYHLFSNPAILERVREQVLPILTTQSNGGSTSRIIDLGKIHEVPILASIIQESLRHRASGAGPRIVLEDVILEDGYLLKKDSYVIIPHHGMHFNEQAWGKSVSEVDIDRFVKPNSRSIHPGAFRGFGGGVNLCPGKHFAMTEIMALLSMFALRFDMKPASGLWEEPHQDTSNLSLAIAPPKNKVIVDIVPRHGWEGGSWSFKL